MANTGTTLLTEDFVLEGYDERVVVLEIDPTIHHLGDDRFSGTINSQFQKMSEGTSITLPFSLNEQQMAATEARLILHAKGLQQDNPVSINDNVIGLLNSSPADGSFGVVSLSIPLPWPETDLDIHAVTIESVRGGAVNDYDDFEFANVLIELTLP